MWWDFPSGPVVSTSPSNAGGSSFCGQGAEIPHTLWLKNQNIKQKFSSVQVFSHVRLSAAPWTQHTRLACPSPTPRVCSDSCPLSWWCHPTISTSVVSFSSCLQSFPASGSLPVSQFFASGGQNIGVSALASVLSMNIQDWFPLGLTGLILQKTEEIL